jgi:hypothetical protein
MLVGASLNTPIIAVTSLSRSSLGAASSASVFTRWQAPGSAA